MKKFIKVVGVLALAFAFMGSVQAQVSVCPAGYTCTKVQCPEGYICTPISSQPSNCPSGYSCKLSSSSTGIVATLLSTETSVSAGTSANDDQGTFRIKFKVTAVDREVYISSLANSALVYVVDRAGVALNSGTFATIINITDTDLTRAGNYMIEEGETETFELIVTTQLDGCNNKAGQYKLGLKAIRYAINDVVRPTNTYATGVDFKTNYIGLNSKINTISSGRNAAPAGGPACPPADNGTQSCYLFSTNLSLGSTGPDVLALNKFLISKGYHTQQSETSYFGQDTKNALIKYQTSIGVPAVGLFGPLTRSVVNGECVVRKEASAAFVSGTAMIDNTANRTSSGIFDIKFKITAGVQPIYLASTSLNVGAVVDRNGVPFVSSVPAASVLVDNTDNTLTRVGNYRIEAGETHYFTYSTSVFPVASSGQFRLTLENIKYSNGDTINMPFYLVFDKTNFRTSYYLIDGTNNKPSTSSQIKTPSISSISPSSARYGDTVTLYGSNLGNIKESSQIAIRNSRGEINPTLVSYKNTSVTFKLPNIPYEIYDVSVYDDNGDSNTLKLTVLSPTQTGIGAPSTSPSSSSYTPSSTNVYTTPYITKISPTTVKAGDIVTLDGVNFNGVDQSLIFIRNSSGGEINPTDTTVSNTRITFKVPNIPYGTYKVSLIGDMGDSNEVNISIGGSTSGASVITIFDWVIGLLK